ncbi:MAG: hypothetical protein ACREBR_00885, partial [bacterium]
RWYFEDEDGKSQSLTTEGYYIPGLKLRLFSPHSHIRGNGDKEGRFAECYMNMQISAGMMVRE